MKQTHAAVAGIVAVTASLAFAGVAGAQDGDGAQTVESTTVESTTVESSTPDTTAPEQSTSSTTPESTVPEPAAPIEVPADEAPPADPFEVLRGVDLPGVAVTSGTLSFQVSFSDQPASSCGGNLAMSGGGMNVAYDEAGGVGGAYGLVETGSGTFGTLFVGFGPIPVGVGIISVSDENCEFDAVGIGTYSASASTAELAGVGIGIHPGAYETGDYVSEFTITAGVGATGGEATLDVDRLGAFLLRDRPGLNLALPGSPSVPANPPMPETPAETPVVPGEPQTPTSAEPPATAPTAQ